MDPLQPWLDAKEVRRLAEGLLAPPPDVEEAAVDAAYGEVFEGFADQGNSEPPSGSGKPVVRVNPAADKNGDDMESLVSAPEPSQSAQAQEDDQEESADKQPETDESVAAKKEQGSEDAEDAPKTDLTDAAKIDSPFQVSVNQEHIETDIIAAKKHSLEDDDVESAALAARAEPAQDVATEPAVDSGKKENKLEARGPFLSRIRQFSEVIRKDLGARAMFLIDVNGQILLDEVENAKLIQVARTLANASQRANRQSPGAAAVGNLHVKIGASSTLEVIPVDSRYGLLILGVIFPGPIGAVRVMQVADELFRTIEPRH